MVNYGLTLADSDTKVPLKDITVHVDIKGFVANVENKLKYKNDQDNPIEAIFVFPMDEQAAIYRFEAIIEGRLIIGECQDKSEAQQTYQDALDAGQSAFLMEESDASGDVFECFVGNIPPQTEVDITFAYAIEMAIQHDGAVKFVYPAVLGPRYGAPVETTASSSAVTAKRSSGPGKTKTGKGPALVYASKEDIPYSFSFTADVHTKKGLSAVTLNDETDGVKYSYGKDKKDKTLWHVKLETEKFKYQFNHDIILCITEKDTFKPKVVLGNGDSSKDGILKRDVAMVNFCPKLDADDESTQKGEFIFVVDRSGSMGGDRIVYAKKALGKFLEILPDDCYFNIISFGSTFDSVFKGGSKKNTIANMKKAKGVHRNLQANYGGTEMVTPFQDMYTWKRIDGYQRQVFVLTDGCIWNTPELIKLVKKNSTHTRVFTFGIGHGASTSLVKGVARAGRGKAEFITDDVKTLPEKVAYILSRAQQPFVSDVTLQWKTPGKGVTVLSLPQHIPPVFFGEKLIIYGVITTADSVSGPQKCKAILEGKIGKKKLHYSLDFVAGASSADAVTSEGPSTSAGRDEAMSIHRLAAKSQIKELEDDEADAGDKNKQTIIMLSTSANIMSKYTAFVGVDHGRGEKITGAMESLQVPLAEVEAKKSKKKRKSAAPAASAAAPSFYGGGSTDSPLVDKYINGKTVSAIPDLKDLLADVSVADAASATSEKVVAMETDNTTLKAPLVEENIADPADSTKRGLEAEESGDKSAPSKKKSKLTHVKQHKETIPLALLQYAPWTDGWYYPVEKVRQLGGKGRTRQTSHIRFSDGKTRIIPTDSVVSASKFSAGDEVLAKVGPNRYRFSLVLEYCPEDDGLILASKDGLVSRFQAHFLALPKETALKMKERKASSFEAVTLCKMLLPDSWGQQELCVTTSDLAELNLEGWINKAIVHMCLAEKWSSELSDDVKKSVSFLSPMFYHTLSQELTEQRTVTRNSENESRFQMCRIWTEAIIDIKNREWVFVPIFDAIHWYVIAVKITRDGNSSDNALRCRYIIMDSYFTADRTFEVMRIHSFITKVCMEQGITIAAKFRTTYPPVPIQENLSDCGVCMLLCIDKCFEDNLDPAPHLKWWTGEETDRKRQQVAQSIMSLWEKQKVKCN